MEIRFDTYYDHGQLGDALRHLVAAYPQLASLDEIGRSFEGREIWALTLTNGATGPAADKPALLVEGNVHGQEVATAMACLHAAHHLLGAYGTDEQVTRLLDEQAFYVVPRINPDGAERAFGRPAEPMISSARPYPFDEPDDGLVPSDLDGDGRVLDMRIEDPSGTLKASAEDPRILVARGPDDEGGTYYRVFSEGLVRNFDGHTIRMARPPEGVNLNRNYPANWAGEATQAGAGPFPLSEPETAAVARFVTSHPNIGGVVDYHTFSGVHLRPYSYHPDSHLPAQDLWTYQLVGERATSLTGYPAISIFHDFRYHPAEVLHGNAIDWFYEELGLLAWTTELWDACTHAGIGDRGNVIDWLRDHPEEDDVALVRWADEHLGAEGYVDWYPFDHPQLGKVELGGWNRLFWWNNPPPQMLEAELRPNTAFVVFMAAILPKLAVRELSAEPAGDGLYTVTLVVENRGFLPTYVTSQALARKAVRPVRAELAGAQVVAGTALVELGHLEGRASKRHMAMVSPSYASTTDHRAVQQWVVRAGAGATLDVTVTSERAGTLRLTLDLPA